MLARARVLSRNVNLYFSNYPMYEKIRDVHIEKEMERRNAKSSLDQVVIQDYQKELVQNDPQWVNKKVIIFSTNQYSKSIFR